MERQELTTRELKAIQIVEKFEAPQPNPETPYTYRVPSQSGKGEYLVSCKDLRWTCTCPDHTYRGVECKHVHAMRLWMNLRYASQQLQVVSEPIGIQEPILECVYCGSRDLRKDGSRNVKGGVKQRFECKSCNRKFTEDAEFGKLSVKPEIIGVVLDLYYKGCSNRKISDHLKQFHKMDVDHSTVYRWVVKYTKKVTDYASKLTPQTGVLWNTDEMMIKINGQYKWLWNTMDNRSRYLLASELSDSRYIADARKAFKCAKDTAKTKPMVLVTDGLHAYEKAFKKEFIQSYKDVEEREHVRCNTIRSKRNNNNVIERYHNTLRERDKVLRGYKKDETAEIITKGFQTYYNLIRPHQGLDGQTPAQKAGVSLNLGEDRWLGLLKRSVRNI